MLQFLPDQTISHIDANVKPGEQDREIPITPSAIHTTPLHLSPDQHSAVTTGQLRLNEMFNSQPLTPIKGGMVRIPGSRKRTPTTEELPNPTRRISHRLRHSVALATLLLVTLITLLSLAPLDNGQSAFPLFQGISDWVHAEQGNWAFQAHELQMQTTSSSMQNTSSQLAPPPPPPVTLPKSQYVAIAQQDALNAGISPDYFTRQINQESGFNPYAVSPSGAEGIAQFEPSTAAGLGVNPFDPLAALNAAAHLMANYAHNYGGNYAMALAAYNGGSGTLQYAINACGPVNWMNCLPAQTRNYIAVIMGI